MGSNPTSCSCENAFLNGPVTVGLDPISDIPLFAYDFQHNEYNPKPKGENDTTNV